MCALTYLVLKTSAFGGKADIVHGPSECLLLIQSGHSEGV
jgi:hypothetical protein